jgi:hypothetical protein
MVKGEGKGGIKKYAGFIPLWSLLPISLPLPTLSFPLKIIVFPTLSYPPPSLPLPFCDILYGTSSEIPQATPTIILNHRAATCMRWSLYMYTYIYTYITYMSVTHKHTHTHTHIDICRWVGRYSKTHKHMPPPPDVLTHIIIRVEFELGVVHKDNIHEQPVGYEYG